MQVTPSSELILLRGVPLDNTYQNTLYFTNTNNQYNYFIGKKAHTLDRQSYQRVTSNKCRISLGAHLCYNCNYMMFKNTGHLNKWFYAFITSIEYVSEVACEVTYEIDVMQTWFFDYTLKECFVEREHSVTDKVGDNILPEPVELGEYVFSDYGKLTTDFDDYYVIVGAMPLTTNVTACNVYNNVVQGLTLFAFDITNGMSELRSFLNGYKSTPQNIVTMYLCPKNVVNVYNSGESGAPKTVESSFKGWHKEINVDLSSFDDFFGSYMPKNNKLLTYPYTYYHVDNNDGTSLQLRFEFFAGRVVSLAFDSTINIPVQVTCRPKNYKNVAGSMNTEVISLDKFPICSWSNDSYTTWVANSLLPAQVKMGASAVSALISAVSGNAIGFVGSAVSGFNTGLNYFIGEYQASISGDIMRGNYQNGNINVAGKMQTFYHAQVKITEDYARTIDDFFTKFGYRTCKVKVPNRSSRPNWNYVKTNGCCIVGNLPADDSKKIIEIYDRGVTFWKNGNNVGNYSLNNSPS